MNFGGPVWHASAAYGKKDQLRSVAEQALEGVGSAFLGEWREWTGRAYHLRRRLRPEEMNLTGPVIDVRGTSEAVNRLRAVQQWLPKGYKE